MNCQKKTHTHSSYVDITMDTKPLQPQHSHINVNQLTNLTTPTVIKTSKQWVLPPRPRPGRKPNANTASQPKKEPKKTYKKKNQQPTQPASIASSIIQSKTPIQALHALQMITPTPSTSASSPSTPWTPENAHNNAHISNISNKSDDSMIQLALKNMEDENQFLKQELSRLVAQLKSLKQGGMKGYTPEDELFHKKRSISDDDFSTIFNIESCEEDDTASQISTPSLVSTSSSMTNSTSSLSSIKEDQVLTIDEFLTTSLFESSTMNSISSEQLMPIPTLPFLKNKIKEEEFEFNFLKMENKDVFKDDASNSLLQVSSAIDTDFWEWK